MFRTRVKEMKIITNRMYQRTVALEGILLLISRLIISQFFKSVQNISRKKCIEMDEKLISQLAENEDPVILISVQIICHECDKLSKSIEGNFSIEMIP